ncbi:hypothetical protein G3T14_17760 [Methylobacterium sp. BTF04]|uniref:hypothetical protein n=1 Tax=Methylobacterium sp. BTF04 TaxID=2708300 RepID=UPI0013D8A48B|nr:hypothetical protein [Methylobacterium sp. BTF04]NEU13960.1 hypothetical protein [Methylobacterium sp. BTF04]
MPFRFVLAACLIAPLLVNPVLAKDPVAGAKEPSVTQTAPRERQKKCGAEWRALSVADKAAKGPKWPQYFSKCVKRLKEQKA